MTDSRRMIPGAYDSDALDRLAAAFDRMSLAEREALEDGIYPDSSLDDPEAPDAWAREESDLRNMSDWRDSR